MDETIYFSDNPIKITSDCVKLGGKSYRLADVTSVRMRSAQADTLRDLPTLLVIAGSILMFALINAQNVLPGQWEELVRVGAVAGTLMSVAGLVMLVLGMLMKVECIYVVELKGVFGNACPIASDDARYVRSLVAAIQTALEEQRTGATYGQQALAETTLDFRF